MMRGFFFRRRIWLWINGSSDSASALAGECVTKLDGFDSAANSLRDSASQAKLMDFWLNVVGSGLALSRS